MKRLGAVCWMLAVSLVGFCDDGPWTQERFVDWHERFLKTREESLGADLSQIDFTAFQWLDKHHGEPGGLRGIDLYLANLQYANLTGADLRGTNLIRTVLTGANLESARLGGAYVEGTFLMGANLRNADMRGATMYGALLQNATLSGARLDGVYMYGADFTDAQADDNAFANARRDDRTRLPAVNIPADLVNWIAKPGWMNRLFERSGLAETHDISFHLNPFYLRGDFNGDGAPDVAIQIRQRETDMLGIAVFHDASDEAIVIAAGTPFRKQEAADFRSLDRWWVYPKQEVGLGMGETERLVLNGEALYVAKSESASGIIYWDGERYGWYQQGD